MDLTTIWKTALGELEIVVSKPNFSTWFKETFIFQVDRGLVVIGVRNSFAIDWLTKYYKEHILKTLQKLIPDAELTEIKFKVSPPNSQTNIIFELPKTNSEIEEIKINEIISHSDRPDNPILNSKYSFDKFIVGTHNRLAHAASLAVASEPGKRHNPLFVYGGVGLGKTHLIQAIGNEILAKNPKTQIIYAPCERFANEFIHAIQTKRTEEFKKKYRNVDLLLIDDIQFLSGKEGTQEEFFHTFNALHQTNRQIILTSDRMPQAIPELESRLSSRFIWGMVVDIKSPDLETRAAILKQKCLEKGTKLDDNIIEFLAQTIQNNVRELEGALNRIIAHLELERIEPTLPVIRQILADHQSQKGSGLTCSKIFGIITGYYGLSNEEILNSRRTKEVVHPRQVLMYILRHELGYSYPQIGRELAGKDHTTIMHGVLKIEKELIRNAQLQQELADLKDQIYRPY